MDGAEDTVLVEDTKGNYEPTKEGMTSISGLTLGRDRGVCCLPRNGPRQGLEPLVHSQGRTQSSAAGGLEGNLET